MIMLLCPIAASPVLDNPVVQAKRNARLRARSRAASMIRDGVYVRAQRSRDAARHARKHIAFRRARSVCVFSSMQSEIDSAPIVKLCRALKKRVWHIVQDDVPRSMEALDARGMGGPAGLKKIPTKKCSPKEKILPIARWTRKISYGGGLGPCVVFVPGISFSPGGARLGRGGGFYDRLLKMLFRRARTVGLCFACQIAEDIPEEAHDRRVDAVLTECGFCAL